MANIYQAKFNINEDIFNVYKGYKDIRDILHYILLNMDSKKYIKDKKNSTKYRFYRLNRDYERNIIFGWVLKIYDEENFNIYIEKAEQLNDVTLKQVSYSIPFSFNLNNKIISFVPKQKFGYKEFINIFKQLFESELPEVGYVNINMKVDEESANQRFSELERMNLFTAVIVPPNGSQDILDDVDGLIDELESGNIKEYRHELKSDIRDPIIKNSKIVMNLRKLAHYGAGYYIAKGKDKNEEWQEINSKKDKNLFVKKHITDSKKDSPVEVMYISENLDK